MDIFKLPSGEKVKISVLVPTYNRADSLKETLHCLQQQITDPKLNFEVIVIDNNSHDHTRRVVKSFFSFFRRKFKYCFEARQGRTHALNQGITKAAGDIVTCLDDDCLVERDYIQNIYNEFENAGPGIGFIGGKILPHWLGGKMPAWLNEFLPGNPGRKLNEDGTNEFFCGPLGILDYGDKPFVIQPKADGKYEKLFYGANISFRKEVFEHFGCFSEKSILVEDTEMCLRLLDSGVKALYAPHIKVFHKIKVDGVIPGYYYRWHFNQGLRREIVQKIDESFCADSWTMFHKSYSDKTMKEILYDRCQALFNFGQMINSWTPHVEKK